VKACPTCGTELPTPANFCSGCGHAFTVHNPPRKPSNVPVPSQGNPSQEKRKKEPVSESIDIMAFTKTQKHASPEELGEAAGASRDPQQNTRAIPESPKYEHSPEHSSKNKSTPQDPDRKNTPPPPLPAAGAQMQYQGIEEPSSRASDPYEDEDEPTRVAAASFRSETRSETSPKAQERRNTPPVSHNPHATTIPSRDYLVSDESFPVSPQRKWIAMGMGATLFTLVGVLVILSFDTLLPGSSVEKPATPAQTAETVLPAVPEPEIAPKKEVTPPPLPKVPEAEAKKVVSPLSGEWILDVDSRLASEEFADMQEAEKNLFRSMMSKKANRTTLGFEETTVSWFETGKKTLFTIESKTVAGKTLSLTLKKPNGDTKVLSGLISDEGLELDDPFGSGKRKFIRP
jgi:hypothetical protein